MITILNVWAATMKVKSQHGLKAKSWTARFNRLLLTVHMALWVILLLINDQNMYLSFRVRVTAYMS